MKQLSIRSVIVVLCVLAGMPVAMAQVSDQGSLNQSVEWRMSFVTVDGMQFEIDGAPFYFTGANFWTAMNLASLGDGGDRDRLDRELDFLASKGVTVLRVMAGTEGPDTELGRVVPALQIAQGVYNPDLLDGLDYVIFAMKQRGMYAVMCLTNFWNWSGGMGQYLSWATGNPILVPPPLAGGDYGAYLSQTDDFYSNSTAMQAYLDHFDLIATRLNPYTGIAYRDEPAIMAWEHANEPMGYHNQAAFNLWIDDAAAHFKSIAPNQLVTVGTWGSILWGTDLTANHDGPNIDYTTIHIWPENFGQFTPGDPAGTYPSARTWATNYFNAEAAKSALLNKPMVLEEFNLGRDYKSYDPSSTTIWRDTFLSDMYAAVYASAQSGGPAAGDQFWAWGGEGRPNDHICMTYPGPVDWMPGDPWIGDPMHECQGWYSVYDIDASTLAVVSDHAAEMAALSYTGLNIEGSVYYYRNLGGQEPGDSPVRNVLLELQGDTTSDSTTSDTGDGSYTFSSLPTENITVTPTKDGDFDGISSLDAAVVSQARVGMVVLTPNQAIAGDVSGNGTISAYDSALISQFRVGVITEFPIATTTGHDWAFTPGSRSYQPLDAHESGQDYVAILYGDVTGDWVPAVKSGQAAPAGARLAAAPARSIETGHCRLSLRGEPETGLSGSMTRWTLSAEGCQGLIGLDLEIEFDARHVEIVGTMVAGPASDFVLISNGRDKALGLSLFSADPLLEDGDLLVFRTESAAGASRPAAPSIEWAEANEGRIPVSVRTLPGPGTDPGPS